jgi:hypothetical protein
VRIRVSSKGKRGERPKGKFGITRNHTLQEENGDKYKAQKLELR